MRIAIVTCAYLVLVALVACAPLDDAPVEVRVPGPTALVPTLAPTSVPLTPTITPVPHPIRYTVGRAIASQQSALENVRLTLRDALLTNEGLDLTVAFENTSDTTYTVSGFVPAHDARLVDAWGQHYAPRNNTTDLQTVSPADGFAPGGANAGVLRFPRPDGPPPYQLLMPAYEPLSFVLDQPATEATAVPEIAAGEYSLGTTLHSAEQALAPISLEVRSVTVATTTLTFDVAFVNRQRQSYRVRGINGTNAWLLADDGTQYRPITVSDTLAQSITPGDAWRPGGENTGTLTFPRPADLRGARLVFASYETLVVSFASDGAVAAHVASSPITARTPAPTAANTDAAFVDLTRLLARQAQALLANDTQAYLAAFAPAAQPDQQTLMERREAVPLASYELAIASEATLDGAEEGTLQGIEVDVRYTLHDVPGDSRFFGSLRYDFTNDGTGWKIAAIQPGQTPPFWQTGDVALTTTEHFLIFTRPTIAQDIAALQEEAEGAYQSLRERGLPLESRYVAYVADTTEDFTTLTGRSTGVLGVAFWQYEINGDAFAVLSRAFYINAAAFAEREGQARRATIAHELAHLALADQTRPFTPAWLKEGIAVYFEDEDVSAVRRQLVTSGMIDQFSLSSLTQNGSLLEHAEQAERISYAYIYSGATIEYLVQRFGEAAVLDLYRSYTEIPVDQVRTLMPRSTESGTEVNATVLDLAATRTDETLVRLFGLTTAQLDAAVKEWLRTQA